jgi:hypothetical protein
VSPRDLVAYEDAQLRRQLAREEASNAAFARQCPGARVTECYQRGQLPPSSFYTTRDWLRYRIDREHTKFNFARCASVSGALYRTCSR